MRKTKHLTIFILFIKKWLVLNLHLSSHKAGFWVITLVKSLRNKPVIRILTLFSVFFVLFWIYHYTYREMILTILRRVTDIRTILFIRDIPNVCSVINLTLRIFYTFLQIFLLKISNCLCFPIHITSEIFLSVCLT